MVSGSLGLVTVEENGRSSVSRDEASTFLQLDQGTQGSAPPVQEGGAEMEDLVSSFDLLKTEGVIWIDEFIRCI